MIVSVCIDEDINIFPLNFLLCFDADALIFPVVLSFLQYSSSCISPGREIVSCLSLTAKNNPAEPKKTPHLTRSRQFSLRFRQFLLHFGCDRLLGCLFFHHPPKCLLFATPQQTNPPAELSTAGLFLACSLPSLPGFPLSGVRT